MTTRRKFLAGIAAALAPGPLAAQTQPQNRMRRLGVADLSDNLMVVVNHRMVTDEATPLAEGDEVGLYLPLEGG